MTANRRLRLRLRNYLPQATFAIRSLPTVSGLLRIAAASHGRRIHSRDLLVVTSLNRIIESAGD